MTVTLDEVQQLADQLSADEQAQLIAYLAHRRAPAAPPQSGPWADLFRIMDELADNTDAAGRVTDYATVMAELDAIEAQVEAARERIEATGRTPEDDAAWAEFFAALDAVAAAPYISDTSATQDLIESRR